MLSRSARAAALLLAVSAALLAGGCGSGSTHNPEELRLERADLVVAVRTLAAAEPGVDRLTAAAKTAWSYVADGIPAKADPRLREALDEAALQAAAVRVPALFSEEHARGLTGPASPLAATYAGYVRLSTRAWRLLRYSLEQIERGTPAAAFFARTNVALYIESVYDAQFAVAQIGKKLLTGYERLGGPAVFGAKLPKGEVEQLVDAYSEPHLRLYPHTGVKLGS